MTDRTLGSKKFTSLPSRLRMFETLIVVSLDVGNSSISHKTGSSPRICIKIVMAMVARAGSFKMRLMKKFVWTILIH